MENLPNEMNRKRKGAIRKVIIRRYSFIIWVPLLIIISNFIGVTFYKILESNVADMNGNFGYYCLFTILGATLGVLLVLMGMLLFDIIRDLRNYLKKGTLLKDTISTIKTIAEGLGMIVSFFIRLPKKIFLRIKDEKRRFRSEVEKEMNK